MSRGFQLTPLQRWHTNGPQAQEKVLKRTSHKGNANQNHFKIAPHSYQNGHHQKIRDKYWWECGEKEPLDFSQTRNQICDPSALAGRFLTTWPPVLLGMQICTATMKRNILRFLKKNKSRSTIWSSNSTSKHAFEVNETTVSKKYQHSVQCSTIHNCKATKTTQMSTSQWTKKTLYAWSHFYPYVIYYYLSI